MDFDKVVEFLRALEKEDVKYVLVDGLALNMPGITRATQDVDIVLLLEKENVERLKRAMRRVWQDPAIGGICYEDLAGDFPAISYGPPDEAFGIDIVTRFGELFPYNDLKAETREWQGVPVPVATPDTLYRMKKDTVRLRDKADAAELRERFHIPEN
jgi:hypothetical protein